MESVINKKSEAKNPLLFGAREDFYIASACTYNNFTGG